MRGAIRSSLLVVVLSACGKSGAPRDLPEPVRVRLAVAMQQDIGHCFGMPGASDDQMNTWGSESLERDEPQVWKAVHAAVSGESGNRRRAIEANVRAVRVELVSPQTYSYTYTTGSCCTSTTMKGTARIRSDGSVELASPIATSKELVPC